MFNLPRVPLIKIPARTAAYPLGSFPGQKGVSALLQFSDRGLELDSGGKQGLAVVGDGEGRRHVVNALLSKLKFDPSIPFPGAFPYLVTFPETDIPLRKYLTFARPSASGEFTDYTARYGALQDEDKETLHDHYAQMDSKPTTDEIHRVAESLRITHLLNVPLIGLSSGQTRRSRIAAGLLSRAKMLLLEDPFAGLDPASRSDIATLLGGVNESTMRTILILRGRGLVGMPEWITDVVKVTNGSVWTGSKDEYVDRTRAEEEKLHVKPSLSSRADDAAEEAIRKAKKPLVFMENMNVSYGSKQVLNNVSWSIYPGDKIHLQGSNGSGKTTLLSLLLGHHPQSYSMPAQTLQLFSKPRREIPTAYLKQWIGHTSPEIFAAFPRNMGLTVGEAIGSGYTGVFCRKSFTQEQEQRIKSLLRPFVKSFSGATTDLKRLMEQRRDEGGGEASVENTVEEIYETSFARLPANLQSVLLFLRAIVSRPRLVVLDEFSQTMDETSWETCRAVLEKEWKEIKAQGLDQAVVVVSHYESEIPWEQGKVLRLQDGRVVLDA